MTWPVHPEGDYFGRTPRVLPSGRISPLSRAFGTFLSMGATSSWEAAFVFKPKAPRLATAAVAINVDEFMRFLFSGGGTGDHLVHLTGNFEKTRNRARVARQATAMAFHVFESGHDGGDLEIAATAPNSVS